MAARIAWVMRATSLGGLAISAPAFLAYKITIAAVGGRDPDCVPLFQDLTQGLEKWAILATIAPPVVTLAAILRPHRSLWHFPPILLWVAASTSLLYANFRNGLGVYGCDISEPQPIWATFSLLIPPALSLALLAMTVLLPRSGSGK